MTIGVPHASNLTNSLPEQVNDPAFPRQLKRIIRNLYDQLDYARGTSSGRSEYLRSPTNGTLQVLYGGTGTTSGVSGGIPYYSATTLMASTAILGRNNLVLGGGATGTPATMAHPSTANQYALTGTTGTSAPVWTIATSSAATGTYALRDSTGGLAMTSLTATTLTATFATFSGTVIAERLIVNGAATMAAVSMATLTATHATLSGTARIGGGLTVASSSTLSDVGMATLTGTSATLTGTLRVGGGLTVAGSATLAAVGMATLTATNASLSAASLVTPLTITSGGTGATSSAAAATSLGVGTGNSPAFTGLTLTGAFTGTTISATAATFTGVVNVGTLAASTALSLTRSFNGETSMTITNTTDGTGAYAGFAVVGNGGRTGSFYVNSPSYTGIAEFADALAVRSNSTNLVLCSNGTTIKMYSGGVTSGELRATVGASGVTLTGALLGVGATFTGAVQLGSTLTVGGVSNFAAATFSGAINAQAATFTTVAAATFTGALAGNAATVTNGVYTNGSYADPAWITSLAASKVGLGNVENTALSTWAGSTAITTLGTPVTAGMSQMGSWVPAATYAFWGNQTLDQTVDGKFAILQGPTGSTFINAASGQNIHFRIANNAVYSNAITVNSDATVGVSTITSGTWNAGAITSSGAISGTTGTFTGILTQGSGYSSQSAYSLEAGTSNSGSNATAYFSNDHSTNTGVTVLGHSRPTSGNSELFAGWSGQWGYTATKVFAVRDNGSATFAGAITIGNTVNAVSPTAPNRTITMVIGGSTYYIHAKTTND